MYSPGSKIVPVAVFLALVTFKCLAHVEPKPKEDWLWPYKSDHLDPKRTHRHVRSCQPITHGNVTHETFKVPDIHFSENFKTSYFARKDIYALKLGGNIAGHVSFISDPLRTFSVLEPRHAGSCSPWVAPRAEVRETASQKKCIIATNGGFFRTRSGGCIGNIYSNGKMIQSARGIQNANFGIREDGSIVTGYLSDDDVHTKVNPFMQLIAGVGWLLRNGEVYTNISKKAECADSEETGSIDRFFGVISARTAVGHDRFGRIVIAHVDGKTDERGVNLETFAQLLKSLGVVNAINLDGGGSTTFVINGTVVNYPSDECGRGFVCPRKVSTVLCFHKPSCVPDALCSNNGVCDEGICKCNKGWSGESCNVTLLIEDGTTSLPPQNSGSNPKSSEVSIGWAVGLAALLAASLIANVCLLNLYLATKWRAKGISRTKEDLQRLLENDEL